MARKIAHNLRETDQPAALIANRADHARRQENRAVAAHSLSDLFVMAVQGRPRQRLCGLASRYCSWRKET
jgi:hypothetical protein